jgi:hypothetical protein
MPLCVAGISPIQGDGIVIAYRGIAGSLGRDRPQNEDSGEEGR